MKKNTEKLSQILVSWYRSNARKLPWRNTRDPYNIWLSEIILQQTTVDQGLPYYLKFLESFPTLKDLSDADIDTVMKLWEGLGYYSRARNLHETARFVQNQLDGVFPNDYQTLINLKGIGPYSAAAISSFSSNEQRVVVDGNVLRFVSRLFGVEEFVDKVAGKKRVEKIATAMLSHQKPSEFNQAIMEFGALVCTSKKPSCLSCVFKSFCSAYHTGAVDRLPMKSPKKPKRKRYFDYAIIRDPENTTFIQKRTKNDIWKGLYEFPLLEYANAPEHVPSLNNFGIEGTVKNRSVSKTYKHILSHQFIYARFICFDLKTAMHPPKDTCLATKMHELEQYALPRLIDLHLGDLSLTLF